MGHQLGNGVRLGSSESPKSERETAMDDGLVVVIEIRKYKRQRLMKIEKIKAIV